MIKGASYRIWYAAHDTMTKSYSGKMQNKYVFALF